MPAESDKRIIATVIAGHTLATLQYIILIPALPLLAEHFAAFGGDRMVTQLVVLVPLASMLIGAPVAGFVGDRIGHALTLRVLLVLFGLCGMSGALIGNITLLAGARILMGVAAGGIVAICSAVTGNVFRGKVREKVLGISYAGASLATILAFPLSGKLVDLFGWRGPFAIYALAFPILLFARTGDSVTVHKRKILLYAALTWRTAGILGIALVLGVGYQVLSAQGPFIMKAAAFETAFEVGLLGASAGIATMAASAAYEKLRSRIGRAAVVLAATLFLAGSVAVMGAFSGHFVILVAVIVFGLGAGLASPVLNSLVLSVCMAEFRGAISGLLISAISLGQFANPMIYSVLAHFIPPQMVLAAVGAMIAACGILMFISARKIGDVEEGL